MTVRVFISGSFIVALLSWSIWILILNLLDPTQAGWLGFSLFFLALFLAISSSTGLLGYTFRRLIAPDQLATYAVRSALRQGVLFGVFLDLLLLLQRLRLYRWYLAVGAIVLFLLIELTFLGYDRASHRKTATPAD